MRNIYTYLDHIEKRPAMYLGNDYGIMALNNFVTGFGCGGGQFYDKKSNYPDFALFTDWLGGMLKNKYEVSAMNWSWLLFEKYKDDKKAFEKFFFYLHKFKSATGEVTIVPLTKSNLKFAVENKAQYLWCGLYSADENVYRSNLKQVNKIILFELKPSRTLFSLILTVENKVIETRNTDMTGKILRNKIEKQFGIILDNFETSDSVQSKKILRDYKIV